MKLFDYIEWLFGENYENIYFLIDIHNTVLHPSYNNKEEFKYFPFAKEALKVLSSMNRAKLIMWTSSHKDDIAKYVEEFKKDGIEFDYINSNPYYRGESYANFESKPFYDVGIDDKFGFDSEHDWYQLYKLFNDIKNNQK